MLTKDSHSLLNHLNLCSIINMFIFVVFSNVILSCHRCCLAVLIKLNLF